MLLPGSIAHHRHRCGAGPVVRGRNRAPGKCADTERREVVAGNELSFKWLRGRMFTTGKAHFGVGAGIPLDWFWRARMVAAVERAGVEQVAGPLKVMVRWGRLPARGVEQSAVTSPT